MTTTLSCVINLAMKFWLTLYRLESFHHWCLCYMPKGGQCYTPRVWVRTVIMWTLTRYLTSQYVHHALVIIHSV